MCSAPRLALRKCAINGGDNDNDNDDVDDYNWVLGLPPGLAVLGVGKEEVISLVVREPRLCDELGGTVLLLGTSALSPLHWTLGGGGNPELCVLGRAPWGQPLGPAWVTCTYSNGSLGSAFCSYGGIGLRL